MSLLQLVKVAAPATPAADQVVVYFDTADLRMKSKDYLGTVTTLGPGAAALTLLRAASGTSTAAGATDVDTVAISGLTALDRILIEFEAESATQLTAVPLVRNVTDAVSLSSLDFNQNIAAGAFTSGNIVIAQRVAGPTIVRSTTNNVRGPGTVSPAIADVVHATFATNWTGAWTLALRHGGVTAGGTFSWTWAVFRASGQ